MQARAGSAPSDHSHAILVLGVGLVIASAMTNAYWRDAFTAATTGNITIGQDNPGCAGMVWTFGELLVVLVLAGAAKANEGIGGLGLALVIGLWVLFLVTHTSGISTVLTRLQWQPIGANPIGGGGGGNKK